MPLTMFHTLLTTGYVMKQKGSQFLSLPEDMIYMMESELKAKKF